MCRSTPSEVYWVLDPPCSPHVLFRIVLVSTLKLYRKPTVGLEAILLKFFRILNPKLWLNLPRILEDLEEDDRNTYAWSRAKIEPEKLWGIVNHSDSQNCYPVASLTLAHVEMKLCRDIVKNVNRLMICDPFHVYRNETKNQAGQRSRMNLIPNRRLNRTKLITVVKTESWCSCSQQPIDSLRHRWPMDGVRTPGCNSIVSESNISGHPAEWFQREKRISRATSQSPFALIFCLQDKWRIN